MAMRVAVGLPMRMTKYHLALTQNDAMDGSTMGSVLLAEALDPVRSMMTIEFLMVDGGHCARIYIRSLSAIQQAPTVFISARVVHELLLFTFPVSIHLRINCTYLSNLIACPTNIISRETGARWMIV
jgi:hypothetical protein